MNVNEVIANRANEMLGGERGSQKRRSIPTITSIMSQSSNDSFPTAMHVAAARARSSQRLVPALAHCTMRLTRKARDFDASSRSAARILQDATPLTLGQEFSGYAAQVESGIAAHHSSRCRDFTRWPRAARRSAPA